MFVGIRFYHIHVHSGTQPHITQHHSLSHNIRVFKVLEHLVNPFANKVMSAADHAVEVVLELAEAVLKII
jgi:hypothetical protein